MGEVPTSTMRIIACKWLWQEERLDNQPNTSHCTSLIAPDRLQNASMYSNLGCTRCLNIA